MRLSGIGPRSEKYYVEIKQWSFARNRSKADFYRDLADRWFAKRRFSEGTYLLNIPIPESTAFRGHLQAVLACLAAVKDESRGFVVHDRTYSALESDRLRISDVEEDGLFYAVAVGKTLFVCDRRQLGREGTEALYNLTHAVFRV
jgi:hypothetical protein